MSQRKYSLKFLLKTRKVKMKIPISWYSIIATFFFVGKFPGIPGTVGSLSCYPLYYLIIHYSQAISEVYNKFYMLLALLTLLATIAINQFQKVTNTCDHSYIVIDEVIGQMLTLAISLEWLIYIKHNLSFLLGYDYYSIIFLISFLLFRYFDIRKPFIIGYINNKMKTPLGVILDDILAAFGASGVIFIIYKCLLLYNNFIVSC